MEIFFNYFLMHQQTQTAKSAVFLIFIPSLSVPDDMTHIFTSHSNCSDGLIYDDSHPSHSETCTAGIKQHIYPLMGDKVSMLTHTYPHKPLRKV